ncbi:probable myosin light chain kinase DDB_G0284661 isoform X2 [Lucilia cuprina]|uniref:probable myosin light chain kinase DDB_G0284661 isoform X2 n=1 Tax=Lucilia cuprina TaxID=7375 RepID=UPI001F06F49A|nr:probable myosin light chain kinase DDB_G0284661 isoform X2 [Lucilia cuprina]
MIAFLTLFLYMTNLTMGYQRLSGNTNHNNVDQKPTHLPPGHYTHGHRWNEPYFDLTMPKNITSLVGKSAYLGCRVKHLGNKTVAWIRNRDLHILTVGTYTYTTDQRFQTSYHRDIDEWTLQIKWAQQRDAGVYECQISTQPVRSFSVNLNIVVPTATILGGPDLYVDKGSTINLTCVIKFSTEPPTHIFWYHQDKVLSEENSGGRLKFKTIKSEETKSILLIDDASLLDSGKYSCYPSNTEIASIRVHVLQGERPEAMQTNAAVATKVQTSNPFTAITTFVATLALGYALATFVKNLQNISNVTSSSNNLITIKATTAAGSENKSGSNFYNNKKSNNNKINNGNGSSNNINSSNINSHSNINNSKSGNCASTDYNADYDDDNDISDDSVSDDKDDDNGNNADFIAATTATITKCKGDFCKEICNINLVYCAEEQQQQQQQHHNQPQQQSYNTNVKYFKSFNIILKKWNQRHALR